MPGRRAPQKSQGIKGQFGGHGLAWPGNRQLHFARAIRSGLWMQTNQGRRAVPVQVPVARPRQPELLGHPDCVQCSGAMHPGLVCGCNARLPGQCYGASAAHSSRAGRPGIGPGSHTSGVLQRPATPQSRNPMQRVPAKGEENSHEQPMWQNLMTEQRPHLPEGPLRARESE